MSITIRTAHAEDAPALATLINQIDAETPYMLFGEGERQMSSEQGRQLLDATHNTGGLVYVAEHERDGIVGYINTRRGKPTRVRHVGYQVLGVAAAYAGQKIGSRLMETSIRWAHDTGLIRLELEVNADNVPARKLYEKYEFVYEGTKRDAIQYHDGTYTDKYLMGLLL
jgi:RimJ/RimL family protein N-acetyltransferase